MDVMPEMTWVDPRYAWMAARSAEMIGADQALDGMLTSS